MLGLCTCFAHVAMNRIPISMRNLPYFCHRTFVGWWGHKGYVLYTTPCELHIISRSSIDVINPDDVEDDGAFISHGRLQFGRQ